MSDEKQMLLVEDDENLCQLIGMMFKNKNIAITETDNYDEGIRLCEERDFDIVVLDYNVKGGIGWDIAKELKRHPAQYGDARTVLMSGTINIEGMSGSAEYDLVDAFIQKPFEVSDFIDKVMDLLKD